MYNIFFSNINEGISSAKKQIKKIIKEDAKVAIFPWAFPAEIDSHKLNNEYFKKGEKRYNKYINVLKEINIKEENITICDCYAFSTQKLKRIINQSDILLFPGGNPEMLFYNILHRTELLYYLKHTQKIIIGESAGAVLQFERYFATAENNFYKYFAFYDGIGVINDPFYIDVHTNEDKDYQKVLQEVANKKSKPIYALLDDGCLIYDRRANSILFESNVIKVNIESEK